MLDEDNLTKQVEEIETLVAIYNDDWKVVDESKRQYEIKITHGEDDSQQSILLQIILPDDYPKSSPPQYQIQASWLNSDERRILDNNLADILIENMGDIILYMWIEKIRDFLQGNVKSRDNNAEPTPSASSMLVEEVSRGTEEDEGAVAMVDLPIMETEPQEYTYDFNDYKSEKKTIDKKDVLKCPSILHGEFVHDRKSTFQAHLAPVHSEAEVHLVMETLLENRKIAAATHNIQAYRICKEGKNNIWYQDCKDDGEIHAGNRILHLMEILEATNVLVVITRWYGGIHLGPDRFKHINNCARTILEQGGYIKNKSDKKGPKSGKKSK